VLAMVLFRFDLARLEELQLMMIINCVVCLLMGSVVTERKRAEQAMAESEIKFKWLYEYAPSAYHLLTPDGTLTDVNHRWCELLGYRREDVLGRAIFDFVVEEERELAKASFEKKKQSRQLYTEGSERNFKTKDGTVRTFKTYDFFVLDQRQNITSVQTTIEDITERKQAEESSRHHLKDLEMLYENSLRINSFLNAEEIGRQVIDTIIRKGLSWRHVAVHLYHPEKQKVEMLVHSYPGLRAEEQHSEKQRLNRLISNPNEGFVGWVIKHGELIRCGNVTEDRRYIMAYPDIHSGIYVPMVVGDRVTGVISVESEQADAFTEADEHLLVTLSAQASVAMENARLFSEIENSHLDLTLAYDETIEGWSKALDFRDKETEGHSKRVTELSWKLARGLGLNQTELLNIRWGALLHDIGKMGIPDAILLKPSSLTELEWMIMKKHTTFAFEWLSPIAYLQKALDIPYCHHEKWDGTGYPRGLKGKEIPLAALLFAIVDVYDALISDRPYRKAWTNAKALEYIEEQRGIHFDPKVVSKFKTIIEKINKSESGLS